MLIYLARNKIDGKCYVGQTRQKLNRRKRAHRQDSRHKDEVFYRAIRKHGWDSFEWEVLEECEDQADLDMAERFWITCYDTIAPKGYNLTTGGQGGYKFSEDVKAKISAARRSPDNITLIKAIGAANRGRARPDTRDKWSKAVSVFDQSGVWVSSHSSAREAAASTGIHFGTISNAVRGSIKSTRNRDGQVFQFRLGRDQTPLNPVVYKGRP